jgi:hypothetical protein
MKAHKKATLAALAAALVSGPAVADETSLGATVGNVLITKPISPGNLGLANKASVKTVAALDLRVSGANPTFTVTGQVFCKNGAKLVAAQAIVGTLALNNGQLIALGALGQSTKLTSIAGRSAADVSLSVTLPVTRAAGDAAIDLTFNPARAYERKLKAYAAKGGSAAEYLRGAEAFDMPVAVNLVGWCKKPEGADSVLAGKTYAGFAARTVPVTILYAGDPKIVDGAGVRAASVAREILDRSEPPPPGRIAAPATPSTSTRPRE